MEITHEGFTITYDYYTSIHYPYTFSFKKRGTTEDAEIITIKVETYDPVKYVIKDKVTDVDLRLLLQRVMLEHYERSTSSGMPSLGVVPSIDADIEVDIYCMVRNRGSRRKEKKKLSSIRFGLSIIDSSVKHSLIERNKRLAPKGAGKPYFVGYPQIDTYTSEVEGRHSNEKIGSAFNVIRTKSSITEGEVTYYPRGEVTREIDECGIFLRWRTSYGSWGYWLFSSDHEHEIKTKSRGSWDYHKNGNITRKHLGLSGEQTWKLSSLIPVQADEIEEVKDLYTSNEVYLYKGDKVRRFFENEFFTNWERVEVVGGNVKFNEPSETYDISVTIEFIKMITRQMVND